MRLIASNTVTTENLKGYFKGYLDNSKWNTHVDNGVFYAWCDLFSVTMIPESVTYDVQVSDLEDPSDSDEGTTDNPAEFIAEFMSTGIGDEFWEKRSSISPTKFRNMMIRLSNDIDNRVIGKKHLIRTLRRSIIAMDLDGMRRMIVAAIKLSSGNFETEEISKLKSQMTEKGWSVRVESSRTGQKIIVDIGGLYEAIIKIDQQLWDCKFEFNDDPSIIEKVMTNDPISAFNDFKQKNYQTSMPPQPSTRRVIHKN